MAATPAWAGPWPGWSRARTTRADGPTAMPTTTRPVDIERQGQPSKWVTLRATTVLRAAYG